MKIKIIVDFLNKPTTSLSYRRKFLSATAATFSAGLVIPRQWVKPVVETVVLPAHAQTTTQDDDPPGPSCTLACSNVILEILLSVSGDRITDTTDVITLQYRLTNNSCEAIDTTEDFHIANSEPNGFPDSLIELETLGVVNPYTTATTTGLMSPISDCDVEAVWRLDFSVNDIACPQVSASLPCDTFDSG
ncbi:MAG: hypothetical protein ACI8P9_000034 [Parasphingorhabdus sp.]